MNSKIIGGVLIAIAIGIFLFVAHFNSESRQESIVFSESTALTALWNAYKDEYIEVDTFRTLDKQRNNITTSEGQSYSMLRAVWMDDQEAFDRSWAWTKKNLGRQHDNLFSWLFGERTDGGYGVLIDQGGNNSATDADVDIAVALLFAHKRWQDNSYLKSALLVIKDIWDKELVYINGRPYLAVSETEKSSQTQNIIVNPSYFTPYAYRMFAEVDPDHDWSLVIDTSYEVLDQSITLPLDKPFSANLVPDWVAINRSNAEIQAVDLNNMSTNYGYDAMRTPWRLALDWRWYQEPRALNILSKLSFLSDEWNRQNKLATTYSHDGFAVSAYESPAMYGSAIGYFATTDNTAGQKIYDSKLMALYNPDTQSWKQPLGYYEDNWAWFGIALWDNFLPNLFASN